MTLAVLKGKAQELGVVQSGSKKDRTTACTDKYPVGHNSCNWPWAFGHLTNSQLLVQLSPNTECRI